MNIRNKSENNKFFKVKQVLIIHKTNILGDFINKPSKIMVLFKNKIDLRPVPLSYSL